MFLPYFDSNNPIRVQEVIKLFDPIKSVSFRVLLVQVFDLLLLDLDLCVFNL